MYKLLYRDTQCDGYGATIVARINACLRIVFPFKAIVGSTKMLNLLCFRLHSNSKTLSWQKTLVKKKNIYIYMRLEKTKHSNNQILINRKRWRNMSPAHSGNTEDEFHQLWTKYNTNIAGHTVYRPYRLMSVVLLLCSLQTT